MKRSLRISALVLAAGVAALPGCATKAPIPLAENFDRAVDLAVSRLRRKLERPGQAALIETVRGAGYRFRAATRR